MADDDSFNETWSDNNAEDDEATIDEEEAYLDDDDGDELKMLEEEQDIPLDQLRAMYGYGVNGDAASVEEDEDSLEEENGRDESEEDEDDGEPGADSVIAHIPNAQHLGPRGYFEVNDDEEADVDNDYVPPPQILQWKRYVSVGPDHQVQVPEYDPEYELEPNDRKNQLLWKPDVDQAAVDKLIATVYEKIESRQNGDRNNKKAAFDNDYVLHKFLQNNYDVEKTIEEVVDVLKENISTECSPAYRTLPVPRVAFTTAEVDSFEQALPVYGKNFFVIRAHALPSRRVGELVEFYYNWKKSERHDVFIERARQRRLNAQEGDPPMLFPVFRRFPRPGDAMDGLIRSHHVQSQPLVQRPASIAENGNDHANGIMQH
ncbi:hypothetical protein QR680_000470 [Steinernema hermaphroditum]|uniref:ELM2 domain-containing protein n=1 Tax=Steinernema hermaphroditum TaxID=289476 RepID=A0AA39GUW7_9BILA|nr:hypothetical protein QR680_000470 [Steinernema hermaphroditum]